MNFFNPHAVRPDSMMENTRDHSNRRRGNSQRMSDHMDTEGEFQKPINFNRLFKDELASGSDDEEEEMFIKDGRRGSQCLD